MPQACLARAEAPASVSIVRLWRVTVIEMEVLTKIGHGGGRAMTSCTVQSAIPTSTAGRVHRRTLCTVQQAPNVSN
jgi:hypothetical protein